MWEWTIKRAVQFSRSVMSDSECWRIDAFELGSWRRLLRVPWTARRSNQSVLKEISPECSLEGLMLELKLQYFGHLMQKVDSLEKTLILGKIEGRNRRGWQRMRWLGESMKKWMMLLTHQRRKIKTKVVHPPHPLTHVKMKRDHGQELEQSRHN